MFQTIFLNSVTIPLLQVQSSCCTLYLPELVLQLGHQVLLSLIVDVDRCKCKTLRVGKRHTFLLPCHRRAAGYLCCRRLLHYRKIRAAAKTWSRRLRCSRRWWRETTLVVGHEGVQRRWIGKAYSYCHVHRHDGRRSLWARVQDSEDPAGGDKDNFRPEGTKWR